MSETKDELEGLTLDSIVELEQTPAPPGQGGEPATPKGEEEEDNDPPTPDEGGEGNEGDPPTPDEGEGNDPPNPDEGNDPPADPPADEEEPQILETVKNSGYEFSDEELDGLDDTPEGLQKATDLIAQKKAEDLVNQFLSSDPRLEAHAQFVMAGGDSQQFLETFYPQDDWTKVEIQDDNLDSQRQILEAYFAEKGTEPTIAKATIDNFAESDKLKENAELALKELQKVQEARKTQLVEQQQAEQVKLAEQQQEAWKKVTTAVEQEASFGGVPIPPTKRKEFLDYMSKPVDNTGRTQRDIDLANMSLEQQLAFEAFLFNGMDVSKLVSTKTRTKTAQQNRFKLKKDDKKQQNKGGSAATPSTGGKGDDPIVSPL